MMAGIMRTLIVVFCFGAFACQVANTASEAEPASPVSESEAGPPPSGSLQKAVFAGGCFWGVEAVFEHVKGVTDARSGYAGGKPATAKYDQVSGGRTGHAESVEVTFDPSVVSYEQLLEVFFSVAHDPTELNRQGPDVGTQYRSAIFYTDQEQKKSALAFVEKLTAAKKFSRPIVTEISALDTFYPAEAYHQDYLKHHPTEPYIVYNDLPKLAALKKQFPEKYQER
jgi:peptide-methionine (S)-S-oxide reductase